MNITAATVAFGHSFTTHGSDVATAVDEDLKLTHLESSHAEAQSIMALSSLGGGHVCNGARDFFRWMKGAFGVHLHPCGFWTDLQVRHDDNQIATQLWMVLPHEVLHSAWLHGLKKYNEV